MAHIEKTSTVQPDPEGSIFLSESDPGRHLELLADTLSPAALRTYCHRLQNSAMLLRGTFTGLDDIERRERVYMAARRQIERLDEQSTASLAKVTFKQLEVKQLA